MAKTDEDFQLNHWYLYQNSSVELFVGYDEWRDASLFVLHSGSIQTDFNVMTDQYEYIGRVKLLDILYGINNG